MQLLCLDQLKSKKNLLAFSAGVDSSALFYLLLEQEIMFDMALVNYQTRIQSDQEEKHARSLAKEYNKKIFILRAEKIVCNFEHEARKTRYQFFERIMEQECYDHLILAHQFNDRLEWFMLSLFKGRGLDSLLGSHALEKRFTQTGYMYYLTRPLWAIPKMDLYEYLKKHQKTYFEDESNQSLLYDRNRIRQQYTDMMIKHHVNQIIQSFEILEQERDVLYPLLSCWQRFGDVIVFSYMPNPHQNIHYISKALKCLGYLLSYAQRQEILKQGYQGVIGGVFGIGVNMALGLVFVSPYLKTYQSSCHISSLKDRMRKLKIPKYNRAYLSYHRAILQALEAFLKDYEHANSSYINDVSP